MNARHVGLDDWPQAKLLWLEFETGDHGWKIEGNLETFSSWFKVSMVNPGVRVFGLFYEEAMAGFAICTEVSSYRFNEFGQEVSCLETFIRGLYIRLGTPRVVSSKLNDLMDLWGRERNHSRRFGNCRMNFPTRAAARYGYVPKCIVMEKEL